MTAGRTPPDVAAEARHTLLPELLGRGVIRSGRRTLRGGGTSGIWFDAVGLAPLHGDVAARLALLCSAAEAATRVQAASVATPAPEERALAVAVAAALAAAGSRGPLTVAVGNGYRLTERPLVEPVLPAGAPTLVVDSLATRGTRVLALVDHLRRVAVQVTAVVLVFDREEGLGPELSARGIALLPLLRRADLAEGTPS